MRELYVLYVWIVTLYQSSVIGWFVLSVYENSAVIGWHVTSGRTHPDAVSAVIGRCEWREGLQYCMCGETYQLLD